MRPAPPEGFVRIIRWKTSAYAPDPKIRLNHCPRCDRHGTAWDGGGFQDRMIDTIVDVASETYRRIALEHMYGKSPDMPHGWHACLLSGAGDRNIEVDGYPVLCHWSRYGTGRCSDCDLRYWHDFGGSEIGAPWHYYHEALAGQQLALL